MLTRTKVLRILRTTLPLTPRPKNPPLQNQKEDESTTGDETTTEEESSSTTGDFKNIGKCGLLGEAMVSEETYEGNLEYYMNADKGDGEDLYLVRFDARSVGTRRRVPTERYVVHGNTLPGARLLALPTSSANVASGLSSSDLAIRKRSQIPTNCAQIGSANSMKKPSPHLVVLAAATDIYRNLAATKKYSWN